MLWRRANGIPERDMRAAESALLSLGGGASVKGTLPTRREIFHTDDPLLHKESASVLRNASEAGSPNGLRVGAADGRIQRCRAQSIARFWIPVVRP
jgi:hypothetical protein